MAPFDLHKQFVSDFIEVDKILCEAFSILSRIFYSILDFFSGPSIFFKLPPSSLQHFFFSIVFILAIIKKGKLFRLLVSGLCLLELSVKSSLSLIKRAVTCRKIGSFSPLINPTDGQ